jgi:hypothetical protein
MFLKKLKFINTIILFKGVLRDRNIKIKNHFRINYTGVFESDSQPSVQSVISCSHYPEKVNQTGSCQPNSVGNAWKFINANK